MLEDARFLRHLGRAGGELFALNTNASTRQRFF